MNKMNPFIFEVERNHSEPSVMVNTGIISEMKSINYIDLFKFYTVVGPLQNFNNKVVIVQEKKSYHKI